MRRVLVANLKGKRIRIRPIKEIVRRILKEEGLDDVEVSVLLTDDGFIQELNRTWRGVDSPTDILAFPFSKKQEARRDEEFCLGEIVISIDTAACQAEELGHTLEKELEILLIHGMLHLLGYDHKDRRDRYRMREREKALASGNEKTRTCKEL